jgi:hypothetical protein
MTGEDSTQIQLTQSVQKLKLGFKTKWGIQRTPYISSYFHDLPVASRQRPLAVPSNILSIQTPFRTLRTYTNALPRHTKEKCLHRSPVASNPANPLQLSPLYGLFVREHQLYSLGILLRLDFSVCNPPVLVKKPKDPVLTILWEKE